MKSRTFYSLPTNEGIIFCKFLKLIHFLYSCLKITKYSATTSTCTIKTKEKNENANAKVLFNILTENIVTDNLAAEINNYNNI